MARKKPYNDYGTGIPHHEAIAIARCILPDIRKFYETAEGQAAFKEWQQQQVAIAPKPTKPRKGGTP